MLLKRRRLPARSSTQQQHCSMQPVLSWLSHSVQHPAISASAVLATAPAVAATAAAVAVAAGCTHLHAALFVLLTVLTRAAATAAACIVPAPP